MNETESTGLIELTVSVVSAYLSNNSVRQAELPDLIQRVSATLAGLNGAGAEPEPEPLKPPVPIRKTITPDYLISLEDGKPYKSLKRHLATHGLTPEEYRQKWGLPPTYPMISATYAAQRSHLAKTLGLGRKQGEKAPPKRTGKRAAAR